MTTPDQEPSDLEMMLWALKAWVERCGAELGDPATSERRELELKAQLWRLHADLVEFNRHVQADLDV